MIEAAIFDMDGLLIDSEPFWRKSHMEVLGNYGFVVTEDDVRAAAGKRTGDQVALWRERFQWEQPSNEVVTDEIVRNVARLIHLNGNALPGVYDIINILKRHNIPMAVASSSATDLIDVVLKRLDIQKYIEFAHSAEHEAKGKPFPDVFLSTAKRLGVAASDCVVFEDSLNGVKAAKAAGMKCVAVPEQPHDAVKFQEADLIVASLEELDWPAIEKLWPDRK
jgi:mannitol-1-/sugar-/sorbitol-6-/2-deoxyglucose-6-phosphatase